MFLRPAPTDQPTHICAAQPDANKRKRALADSSNRLLAELHPTGVACMIMYHCANGHAHDSNRDGANDRRMFGIGSCVLFRMRFEACVTMVCAAAA